MATNQIFCTHCGAGNQPSARFCYRCGQPIQSNPPTPGPESETGALTLVCPTCGGKLQVTPDISRFACMYCGNEHIVRRGEGYVTIEPVLHELHAVRQDLDQVQKSGVDVIRQANHTAQAARSAQTAAAHLAQSGALMQQISLLEKDLDEKRKNKVELEKGNGCGIIGIGIGLSIGAVLVFLLVHSTDQTLALVLAYMVGTAGSVCLFIGIIQALVFLGKKPKIKLLNQEINAAETQIEQYRAQINQ